MSQETFASLLRMITHYPEEMFGAHKCCLFRPGLQDFVNLWICGQVLPVFARLAQDAILDGS
jgi:hypothetical protein